MSIFCRLCAGTKDESDIVTSINDAEHLTEQKLIACCQWNPQNTEFELPQDVCALCFTKLENCWSFLQSVQSAQRKIHTIFENQVKIKPPKIPKTARAKFECIECSNVFPSRIALEKHECTPVADLKCNICNKKFKTTEGHQSHCKKKGRLKCELCHQAFCSNKALLTHKQQHNDDVDIPTEPIDIVEIKPTFVDCSNDINEALEIEAKQDEIPSIFEEKPFTASLQPIDDIKSQPISISISSMAYAMSPFEIRMNFNENLEPPLRNKFPSPDRIQEYHCYLCNRKFKKFPLLRYHMVVHTLPRKYKCQYCNARFRTERHYTSHQKNHVDYYCETCNKKFNSAFALKVHRRMHVGASVKMYGCEECDHFFVDVSTYYNHMRRRHGLDTAEAKKKAKLIQPNGTAKPYVCEQCGKDFLERSSLKAHAAVHLDIRPFQCDICPKAFKNKYNLKTHQESHTGVLQVQCNVCGKKYSRKSVLIKHMEEHTGVYTKTFSCDFCDRVFRSLYNMQNHRRTHTGEKPFRCDVCNHDVTTKSQLDRHLKTISHMNKLNESLGIHVRPN